MNWSDWNDFLETVDFGDLNAGEIIDNALLNIADVPDSEKLEVAKATVQMYIDQNVSSF